MTDMAYGIAFRGMARRPNYPDANIPCQGTIPRRCRLLITVAVPLAIVVGYLTPWASQTATGNTMAEISAEMLSIDEETMRQERIVAEKRKALASLMRADYKTDEAKAADSTDVLEAAPGTNSLDVAITCQRYTDAMRQWYVSSINTTMDVRDILQRKQAKLTLLKEQMEREQPPLSVEEMDSAENHFCQWNGPWSNLPYFGGEGTVANSGCGLCSYTTMVNVLTGSHYDPSEMLSIRGDWYGCEEILDQTTGTPDGKSYKNWTRDYFGIEMSQIDDTVQATRSALEEGNVAVIVGTYGPNFLDNQGNYRYSSPHYVCAYRCDKGGIYVHDSALTDEAGTAVYYTDAQFDALVNGIAGWLVKCKRL